MIVSVRESKARLSELIAKASEGEEVLISVRGKPTARLIPVASVSEKPDLGGWINERRKQLAAQDSPPDQDSSAAILDDLREERW